MWTKAFLSLLTMADRPWGVGHCLVLGQSCHTAEEKPNLCTRAITVPPQGFLCIGSLRQCTTWLEIVSPGLTGHQ